MWTLLHAITHIPVEPHAIRCDNFTKQSDVQMQTTAVESLDFTRSKVKIDNEIHDVSIMLSLGFISARVVDVVGQ